MEIVRDTAFHLNQRRFFFFIHGKLEFENYSHNQESSMQGSRRYPTTNVTESLKDHEGRSGSLF